MNPACCCVGLRARARDNFCPACVKKWPAKAVPFAIHLHKRRAFAACVQRPPPLHEERGDGRRHDVLHGQQQRLESAQGKRLLQIRRLHCFAGNPALMQNRGAALPCRQGHRPVFGGRITPFGVCLLVAEGQFAPLFEVAAHRFAISETGSTASLLLWYSPAARRKPSVNSRAAYFLCFAPACYQTHIKQERQQAALQHACVN